MNLQNPKRDDGLRPAAGPRNCDADNDRGSLCLDCAVQGHTCCQGHDIYVTPGDCERISRHGGYSDFYEYRGCAHAAYADQDDDPLWRYYVFRRDGSRRVLKRLSGGDCLFLGPAGCALMLTVRPLVCRLYPHLYSAVGISGRWDGECPATRKPAGPAVMEEGIAGVAWQAAVQWHRMLYTEILQEAAANENRSDL
jgi:Fe-S-cluster containining protein